MRPEVEFRPVFLATRRGQEPARLVFADERIVAILVPISPEDNEADTEGWYQEVGFGPCECDGLLFSSLGAAEIWVRDQIKSEATSGGAADTSSSGFQQASTTTEKSPRSLRILIVEDDAIQAMGLEAHIERLGHEAVGMVATASAAVAAAEEHHPDLVFMDVRLADGTNGIDAAAEIRNRFGIPSIFMTAHADVQTRARIEQVRAVELLPKPVSPASISAALNRVAQL